MFSTELAPSNWPNHPISWGPSTHFLDGSPSQGLMLMGARYSRPSDQVFGKWPGWPCDLVSQGAAAPLWAAWGRCYNSMSSWRERHWIFLKIHFLLFPILNKANCILIHNVHKMFSLKTGKHLTLNYYTRKAPTGSFLFRFGACGKH